MIKNQLHGCFSFKTIVSHLTIGLFIVLVATSAMAQNKKSNSSLQKKGNSVAAVLRADAGSDNVGCPGSEFTLGGVTSASGGTGPYTYDWTPGEGIDDQNAPNPLCKPIASGWYFLRVRDSKGDNSYDSCFILVHKAPSVDAGKDIVICSGDTIALMAKIVDGMGLTFIWTPTVGLKTPLKDNTLCSPNASTKYRVQAFSFEGCVGEDSVTITVRQTTPAPVILGPTSSCSGARPTYQVANVARSKFHWSVSGGRAVGSDSTNKITVAWDNVQAGYLTVVETKADGCKTTSEELKIPITVLQTPTITASGSITFCAGNSVSLVAPDGFTQYQWSNGATTKTLVVRDSGSYTCRVFDGECNALSNALKVNVLPNPEKPEIHLTSDTLFSTKGYLYQWFLNDVKISGARDPIFSPRFTGYYSVDVFNATLCATRSEKLFVTAAGIDSEIMSVLNVFPIPAIDEVTISVPASTGEMVVELTSSIGQTIDVRAVGNHEQHNITISVVNLESGWYTISANDGIKRIRTSILIQR